MAGQHWHALFQRTSAKDGAGCGEQVYAEQQITSEYSHPMPTTMKPPHQCVRILSSSLGHHEALALPACADDQPCAFCSPVSILADKSTPYPPHVLNQECIQGS